MRRQDRPFVDEGVWVQVVHALDGLTLPQWATPSLWVLAGNHRSVLDRLRTEEFESLGVRIVAPAADGTELQVPSDARDKVVTAFGQAAQLVNPVLGLVVALGDLADSVFGKIRSASTLEEVSPHRVLWDTIVAASEDQPAVVVVDDITREGRDLIWSVVSSLSSRLPERRVLFMLGAQGPPRLGAEAGSDPIVGWSPLLSQVRAAVVGGRARWSWIEPLDGVAVQRWVGPLEENLAQRLVAISGGESMIAARRWQQWREKRYVAKGDGGVWAATGAAEPFEADFHAVLAQRVGSFTGLPAHLEPIRVAADALELAAICATVFSAAAIADHLSEAIGVDATIIEELLDELAPSAIGLPWLIDTCGHTPSDGPDGVTVDHWLYRFASVDYPTYLLSRAQEHGSDTVEIASELLKSLHRCHHRLSLFDSVAGELARAANDTTAAAFYAHRIESVARQGQLFAYALFLLSLPDTDLDVFVLDDLTRTANDLRSLGQLSMAVGVAERAYTCAKTCGATSQKVQAIQAHGLALDWAGFSVQAIGPLTESADLHRRLHNSEPTNPTYQRDLAISLGNLGVAQRDAGQATEAIGALTESVDLHRRLHNSEPTNPAYHRDLAIAEQQLGGSN